VRTTDWSLLNLGGYHFISYLAVLGVLFVLLVLVVGMTWCALSSDADKVRDADPAKSSPLAVNRGTLQRAALISVCLTVYNAMSVVFANAEQAHSDPLAISFGLTSGLLGMLLFFSYILRSESYVIIWCGTNKVVYKDAVKTPVYER